MEKLIIVGKIGAPHGVRGDVRITPLTDFPDRFTELKKVFLNETEFLEIEQVKYQNTTILLKFKGVDTCEAVDKIKGKLLKIQRKDVAPLAPGEYYSFDIIGLDVYNERNEYLGKITEILKTGSNDVYVATLAKRQILIPALKAVVNSIDLANGKMQITLPEEME